MQLPPRLQAGAAVWEACMRGKGNPRPRRAKDLWHLCSRIMRKILSHTVAAWINVSLGHRPLDFASLVSE
jgi:hypothetical protein